jgi:uncharacterized membrane-anchored protein
MTYSYAGATRLAAILTILLLSLSQAAISDESAPPPDSAASQMQKQLQALHWIKGPQHVELYGNAALDLPEGYLFLNPDDAAKLRDITHNVGSAKQYFLAPDDLRWGAYFTYQDDGYVKDGDKIDDVAILANIKKSTEAANEERREHGWHQLEVTGWQTPPHYDQDTKQLEWAIDGRDLSNSASLVNFNTRILGRGGVMSIVLLSDPAHIDAAIADLKSTLSHFSYLPGQRYAEYKPGDKVAKYGLAALITGGAAAIAIKTGFWKVLLSGLIAGWKFVVAGAVAVAGGISRWFKRKPTA